jgi:hypothetical protein
MLATFDQKSIDEFHSGIAERRCKFVPQRVMKQWEKLGKPLKDADISPASASRAQRCAPRLPTIQTTG